MCGVFGLVVSESCKASRKEIQGILNTIALLSESRGRDSSGLAVRDGDAKRIEVLKGDIAISELLSTPEAVDLLDRSLQRYDSGKGLACIGHARLVTNGSQLRAENNQPVIKRGIALIHNGIIVNADDIWASRRDLKREFSIDTEILTDLMRTELESEPDVVRGLIRALRVPEGTFSIAAMIDDVSRLVLATNNGSLYYTELAGEFFVFGSEYRYLRTLIDRIRRSDSGTLLAIKQVRADQGILVDTATTEVVRFSLQEESPSLLATRTSKFSISTKSVSNKDHRSEVVIDPSIFVDRTNEGHLMKALENHDHSIGRLRRCTRCILPETFPFIYFDDQGVCNYCRNYKPKALNSDLGLLRELVEPYRRRDGTADCLVPFSGGRDSTYSLHIVKRDLGLNPIALTYDWGMVTDLARRNIARVCGKLGVENIIVSANIRWKRDNIRKNILAWLKAPDLGMIPLFMAGDKYFFYHTARIQRETGIDLNIWGINHLENTDFKTGFAGLAPVFDKKRIYSLSFTNQLRLFKFVARNLVKSPEYINQSIFDSLGSFAVRYIYPKRHYYHLFDFYKWDENEINDLITNEYKWESAIDTTSTWRVGDGTASFYNYIYYTVTGFTENDTFRSNQVREGMMTREQALELVAVENRPRYETLRWYLKIVNLDFLEVITRVNAIPKLFQTA
jgi:glucosamine--fructose-6-phosphate aminotransferase (isomerizing)